MLPQHIELVQSTVPVLRESGVILTDHFYQRMLQHHPELKNVFNLEGQNSGRQSRALAAAVLAYAEHIDRPNVLSKAIERITTKHISLNIQEEQYAIVGEHLLHSISEVLSVSMESELISAWKNAYFQLAEILINVEKNKYLELKNTEGGWNGWRDFVITSMTNTASGQQFQINPKDQNGIIPAQGGDFISIKVKVPHQDLEQPQQVQLKPSTNLPGYLFDITVTSEMTEIAVEYILSHHYQVGDVIKVTPPTHF